MQNKERSRWPGRGAGPIWMLRLYVKMRAAAAAPLDERGQDLIEYALVAALISLAAVAGMQSVATALGAAFTNIGSNFSTYTS